MMATGSRQEGRHQGWSNLTILQCRGRVDYLSSKIRKRRRADFIFLLQLLAIPEKLITGPKAGPIGMESTCPRQWLPPTIPPCQDLTTWGGYVTMKQLTLPQTIISDGSIMGSTLTSLIARRPVPLLLVGCLLAFVLGCQEEPQIRRYQVAREDPIRQPWRLLGAIIPQENQVWFFRLEGPTE